LPGINLLKLKSLKLFLPIGATIVPKMKINHKAITLEIIQVVDEQTNILAGNREPKDLIGDEDNIKIRSRATQGRLKERTN
jgi:hypothetical protein